LGRDGEPLMSASDLKQALLEKPKIQCDQSVRELATSDLQPPVGKGGGQITSAANNYLLKSLDHSITGASRGMK
jgi:hypothetical protein